MDKFLEVIINFFKALFKQNKIEPKATKPPPLGVISHIPKLGENSSTVGVVQKALKVKGYNIKVDNDFGPKTLDVVSRFQRDQGMKGSGVMGPRTIKALGLKVVTEKPNTPQVPIVDNKAPWFWNLKKHSGKVESNPAFNKEMSKGWKLVGLPGFKSIIGSKRAWCGLFIAVGLSATGYHYQKDGAGAKNWDKFGNKIEWKKNGFPQGAIIRLNPKSCKSGSGNHVTMANGNCSASDLNKPGATFSAFGGNQGNKAKVSTYRVRTICTVSWPKEKPLPSKVTKSLNCSNGETSNESTR